LTSLDSHRYRELNDKKSSKSEVKESKSSSRSKQKKKHRGGSRDKSIEKMIDNKNITSSSSEHKKNKMLFKVLMEKIKYFTVNTIDSISPLQAMLIEMKVRKEDWEAGELSDKYLTAKLEDVQKKLNDFGQNTVVPQGWSCEWSRYQMIFRCS